jgi:hypothetical protein
MKTKKLNMRSSRMRSSQIILWFGNTFSKIITVNNNSNVCSSKISKIPMDPIPWSNVSYLVPQSGNGYILNYTSNNSNYGYSTFKPIPSSLQPTIDKIRVETITINYLPVCKNYIENYNISSLGALASGQLSIEPILNSDFRFIVIVKKINDQNPAGYFYVDVSNTGAVTLST